MRKVFLLAILSYFVTMIAFGQIKNIKVDVFPERIKNIEPTIAINPRNTKNIVAAAGSDNIYYSVDGGLTWQKSLMTSPLGMGNTPVVIASGKGDFYYLHLSDPTGEGRINSKGLDQIVCHVSEDGGKTWDAGNSIGYNPPKDQDKPWATIDDKGNLCVTWTQFDQYGSTDSNCLSTIMLSRSGNGRKWSKPVEISQTPGNCADEDNTAAGAVPAFGADGKIFVVWGNQEKIFMDRSYDGSVWLSNDVGVVDQVGGRSLKIPGEGACNGKPILVTDRSKLQTKGVIYLVWADQRKGETNTDIWFTRSVNFGDFWMSPLKVNDDTSGKHQYLPCLTIDQSTGYIYVVYYDRRNYDDNRTDVYLAYSVNAGNSFTNVKISEASFTPVESTGSTDYIHIAAQKGIITPIWTRFDGNIQSVYTAVITHEELVKMTEEKTVTEKAAN